MLFTLIVFIAVLGVLVFVHELGHFLAAKKAGLRVEEFGFGFPPRMFGIKRGDTVYSLNWLPFGGFVRIHGEGGEDEKNPKSFASRTAGVRALILGAGILMNLLLAMVLFSIGLALGYPQALPDSGAKNIAASQIHVNVTAVSAGSPAESAGLKPFDEIVSIDGHSVYSASEVREKVNAVRGKAVPVVYTRGGEERTATITPRLQTEKDQGALGIEIVTTAIVRYPWYQALWLGVKTTFESLFLIIISLYGLVRDAFVTGSFNGDAVTGPIGIASLSGQFARQGFVYVVWFMAFLSVNLAFMNALPIPALDGGRLLFVLIEKIRGGKKVRQETESLIHTIGFMILLGLIIVVTFKDLIHFRASFEHVWSIIRSWF